LQEEQLSRPFPEQNCVAVSELNSQRNSALRFPINCTKYISSAVAGGEEQGEEMTVVLGIKKKKRWCHYQVSSYKSKLQNSMINLGAQSSDSNTFS